MARENELLILQQMHNTIGEVAEQEADVLKAIANHLETMFKQFYTHKAQFEATNAMINPDDQASRTQLAQEAQALENIHHRVSEMNKQLATDQKTVSLMHGDNAEKADIKHVEAKIQEVSQRNEQLVGIEKKLGEITFTTGQVPAVQLGSAVDLKTGPNPTVGVKIEPSREKIVALLQNIETNVKLLQAYNAELKKQLHEQRQAAKPEITTAKGPGFKP